MKKATIYHWNYLRPFTIVVKMTSCWKKLIRELWPAPRVRFLIHFPPFLYNIYNSVFCHVRAELTVDFAVLQKCLTPLWAHPWRTCPRWPPTSSRSCRTSTPSPWRPSTPPRRTFCPPPKVLTPPRALMNIYAGARAPTQQLKYINIAGVLPDQVFYASSLPNHFSW